MANHRARALTFLIVFLSSGHHDTRERQHHRFGA